MNGDDLRKAADTARAPIVRPSSTVAKWPTMEEREAARDKRIELGQDINACHAATIDALGKTHETPSVERYADLYHDTYGALWKTIRDCSNHSRANQNP